MTLKETIKLIQNEIDITIQQWLLGNISKKDCMQKTGYSDSTLKNIKNQYKNKNEKVLKKYFTSTKK